ncbi:MAG: hypothetical protein QOI03_2243 [Solirubrobacteraceae bacterium]|jgi:diguanylate cyclase (GGDEF)-like protein|nr:hypothetical protein [Solirubrobacteraceae bacterium]
MPSARRTRQGESSIAGPRSRVDGVGVALLTLSALTLVTVVGEYLVSASASLWVADAGWTGAALVAIIGVAAATHRSTPRDRPGWALLLAGCVAWLIGQLFWNAYCATSFPPSPNPADACALAFAVVVGAGMHRLCRGGWRVPGFSMLEVAPLIVAVSALVVALLWGDIRNSRLSAAGQATSVAYPIFYVSAALVMLQSVLAGGLDLRRNRAVAVVLGGLALSAIGFILWSPELLSGSYVAGVSAVDALWSVGLIVVGVGAWAAGPSIALPAGEHTRLRRGGLLPALTFVILAGVQVAFNTVDGGDDLVLGIGVSIIGVTLIVHGWLLQRDEAVLFATLRERERDLAEANRRLGEESRRDPLTGLGNRLRLGEDFADIAALAKRYGQGFCLVLIDLDRFKDYNDDQGHQAGDRVLEWVAGLLKEEGREVDLAYRYGGEELLLIVRHQGAESGQALAERRRLQLQDAALPHPRNVPHGVVTLSAGIAAARDGETPEQVLRRADTALYQAKAQGRNRVMVDSHATPPSGHPETVALTH